MGKLSTMNAESNHIQASLFCSGLQTQLKALHPGISWFIAPKNDGPGFSFHLGNEVLPSEFIVLAEGPVRGNGAKIFAGVVCSADEFGRAPDRDTWLRKIAQTAVGGLKTV